MGLLQKLAEWNWSRAEKPKRQSDQKQEKSNIVNDDFYQQSEYERQVSHELSPPITELEYQKYLNQQAALDMGDILKFDAFEISAHMMSAPDHEPVQGRVFLREQYERMQAGLDFVDIDGFYYQPISRPICSGDCGHFASPFDTEISKRRWSDEELAEYAAKNAAGCIIDGKHYSMYEAGQLMKKVAQEVRFWKEEANEARLKGDWDKRRECQRHINELSKKYHSIENEAHLRGDLDDLRVKGFRFVKIELKEEVESKEFQWLQSNLPDICPKSLTGYRRMKKQNTKNYQKIVDEAQKLGYEIEHEGLQGYEKGGSMNE